MKPKTDDFTLHETGSFKELFAPIQLFTADVPNTTDHEVMKAKKLICEMASAMGFTKFDSWKLQRYRDVESNTLKWRLEGNFAI